MTNREFLMLSQKYRDKHNIAGWWASEKLDGHRVFWDGGITRGLRKSEVPWANTDKDERFVTPQYSTGLWTRYGNLFHAPDWWLDSLPLTPLDGELFSARGAWQTLSKAIKRLVPDDAAWKEVKFHAFDNPPYLSVFANGRINNPNFSKEMVAADIWAWVKPRLNGTVAPSFRKLHEVYAHLTTLDSDRVVAVQQHEVKDRDDLLAFFDTVVSGGGEGLIIRNPNSYWEPKRSHHSLKLKPEEDSEATIIGYTWGRETDKGSKLLGKMGAAICQWVNPRGQDVTFELSGFTDMERIMECVDDEGYLNPGLPVSEYACNPNFPRGTRITFRYTELTDDGLPKCARYWRTRPHDY